MKVMWAVFCLLMCAEMLQAAESLRVVMKNGTLYEGRLVGYDEKTVTLSETKGKAVELDRSKIKKVFDAESGKVLSLNELAPSADAPEAPSQAVAKEKTEEPDEDADEGEVQSAPVTKTVSKAKVGIRPHALVGLDLGMSFPFKMSEDSVKKAWEETVPPQATWDSFPMMLTLDMDLWIRPSKYFSVGPFFTWYILGQGQTATLVYPGGSFAQYLGGGTWYFYETADTNVTFDAGFPAVAYGGAVRFSLPFDDTETGAAYLEGDFGQLSLADSYYAISVDGNLRYQETFSGNAPYTRVALGIEGRIPDSPCAVDFSFGYRAAEVEQVTYDVIKDDYHPGDIGSKGVVRYKDGTAMTVNFSAIDLMIKFGLRF